MDLSEKIGTFETSIQPFEDCCTIFVAKHPVTKTESQRDPRFRDPFAGEDRGNGSDGHRHGGADYLPGLNRSGGPMHWDNRP